MGDVHNEIRRSPVGAAIKDALGVTDGASMVERFGETLTPVLDIWALPEWAFLRDERLYAFARQSAAVAGEFSAAALINPAGSKALAVLDHANWDSVAVSTVAQLQEATEAVILATIATGTGKGNPRDLRITPQGNSVCNLVVGSDPASNIGNLLEQRRTPGNESTEFLEGLPMVLPPGFGAIIICLTANQTINVNWAWRERPVFPAELG